MSVKSLLRPYDIDLPQNPMVEVPSSGWELLKAQAEAFRAVSSHREACPVCEAIAHPERALFGANCVVVAE